MRYLFYLLLLIGLIFLTRCGVTVKHGGEVTVKHELHIPTLEKYFDYKCRKDLGLLEIALEDLSIGERDQLDACIGDHIYEMIEVLGGDDAVSLIN